ncbi:MAG TPA: sigma-70 family RNA polymerase sigma factor [Streptosporangiaceae bacterium]
MTASEEFTSLTGPFRVELLAHCYRMLGSADEAEDLVQETYLRAWRSFDGFEGRSSVRTWLYRIATNACLTAIERRSRRPLPSGLGGPREDPEGQVVSATDVPWLQPFPDVLFGTNPADPSAIAASRAGMRLALVAALQYLSAKQRAVLILRDVLDWPAAQAADLLGTSTTAVNSALRRARAHLERVLPAQEQLTEPASPERRDLVGRYAAAFENADVPGLVDMLREDVTLEMPPVLTWFRGREVVANFFGSRVFGVAGPFRMVPTTANGQPALAVYERGRDGRYHAHGVQVLTVTESGIAQIVVFLDPGLIPRFGLPPVYSAVAAGSPPAAQRAGPA